MAKTFLPPDNSSKAATTAACRPSNMTSAHAAPPVTTTQLSCAGHGGDSFIDTMIDALASLGDDR